MVEQDSELQRFLSGVKDNKTNSPTATKVAVTPASQTNVDEATAAFSSADATTDPKSEVIAAGAMAAAATPQKAATAGRAARTKSSKSKPLPIKWIAAGALGVVLVLLGILVVVRDDKGNKVAEVVVPPGGSVEVKQTAPVVPGKSATPAPSVPQPATKSTTPSPSSYFGGNTSASKTPPPGEYGLQFTDRNTKVEAPNPGLDITRPFTVEAYLTLGDLPANGIKGLLQLVSINDEFGIQIRNSQWAFFSKHNHVTATPPLTPNRRIHFAGVRTSTQRKLYLDGKLAASMDDSLPKTPNEQRNVLSIDAGNGVSFTIDALRITQGTPYLQNFTPPQRFAADKETRLLYQFDEGQGDTVQDSSGNGYHGKIRLAKWVQSSVGAPRWPFDPPDSNEYVWSTPENLGPSVNTARSEYVAGISADENVLYFYNLNDEPIKFAKRTDATQPLGPAFTVPILGNILGAGISSDQLSAVLERKSLNGESEFWLSSRPNAAGFFAAPIRATEPVNVNIKVHQSRPVLSPDGLTLLLCSARQPSQRADIWMFTRTAIAEQFTTAERLAEPISTPDWDMPYFISNDRCLMIASWQSAQGAEVGQERRRVLYYTRSKPTDPFSAGIPLDIPLGAQQENTSNDGFRLSGDGRAIYFGSGSLSGGHGTHDIWVTRRVLKVGTAGGGAASNVVYLDDLPELEFRVWDDRGLGKHGKFRDQGKDEQTIQWRGKPVAHSLWMHPPRANNAVAFVRYQLDGKYQTFAAEAGIPPTTSKDPQSPVHFRVLGDGRELWKSPPLQTRGESAEVSVDVRGVKELRLETSRGDKNGNCHATWFMPRLTLVANTALAAPPAAVFPFDAATAAKHQAAWAAYLGVPVEFTNGVGMKFRLIPPGEFQMGLGPEFTDEELRRLTDEKGEKVEILLRRLRASRPAHPVRITRPFYLEVEEVTSGHYRDVVGQLRPEMEQNPNKSLHNYVAWPDVIAFCNKLSEREGKRPAYRIDGDKLTTIDDADGYRLPTEAQWEYACRAGTNTLWYFGNNGSADPIEFKKQYAAPNPFGLFGLYAGSNEWCWDGSPPSVTPAPYSPAILSRRDDPREDVGPHRIKRGGSGNNSGGADRREINSFARESSSATVTAADLTKYSGFGRVVLPIARPDLRPDASRAGLPGAAEIDLLPLINPALDTLAGTWTQQGTAFHSGAKEDQNHTLRIPVEPGEAYSLQIAFDSERAYPSVILPVPGKSKGLTVSFNGGAVQLISQGLKHPDNLKVEIPGYWFNSQQRNHAVIDVTRPTPEQLRVQVAVAGQPRLDWTGKLDELSNLDGKQGPEPSLVFESFLVKPIATKLLEAKLTTHRGTVKYLRPTAGQASANAPPAQQLSSDSLDRQVAQRLLDLKFPVRVKIAGKVVPLKPGTPLPAEPFVLIGIDAGAKASVPRAELVKLLGDFRHLASVENTFLPTQDCDLWAEAFGSMPSIMAVNAASCEELTDVGAGHLARLPNLEYVNLGSSLKITGMGLAKFAACKSLTTIELNAQAMTDGKYILADIQKLQDALPTTRVVFGGVKPVPGLKPATMPSSQPSPVK